MSKTEREIVKSLRQLGNDIKMEQVAEKRSREMLLHYFKENFSKTTNFDFIRLAYSPACAGRLRLFTLKPVAVSLLVLFFIFAFGSGLVYISKSALPGNFLYPVKLGIEKAQMVLAFNQSQKTVLRAEILTNRLSEVKVLAEKVEQGDEESEPDLQDLTKSFTDELYALKKQVVSQIQAAPPESAAVESPRTKSETVKPFPDRELLAGDQLLVINSHLSAINDSSSLPIQDQRQVFTVIQSQELKQLLSETKELLAEDNLVAALATIEQAEKVVKPSSSLKPSEEEQKTPSDIEGYEFEQPAVEQKSQSSIINQKGSTGQVLQKALESTKAIEPEEADDFKVDIRREVPVKTGVIREK